jgi:predicted TIM-barrel fold metal-dependent hydrolase
MPATAFPPPKSCDCHVHVIGPKSVFPLAPGHRYTPRDALADELAGMLKRLGMDRVVLVQPSFYGTDNACMLDAMLRLDNARGVAVLPAYVAHAELDELHAQGIRGLRVNVATYGGAPMETIRAGIAAATTLCVNHGWHVQIFVDAASIEPLSPILLGLPVPVVIDHFGLIGPDNADGPVRALVKLLESGNIWVKISGAYRIADDPTAKNIDPLARVLCKANPERIVWGSDWPHTPHHGAAVHPGVELPFQKIDTRGLLDLLPRWLDDDALVRRVLVDNPAALYGF